MFKSKNKKAFTLVEFMTILFVMSIVVMVTLAVKKPFDRPLSRSYERAYKALYYAVYNVIIDSNTGVFPVSKAADLCTALVGDDGYINALPNTIFCGVGATTITDLKASQNTFDTAVAQFVASNGMKFYIATDEANGGFIKSIVFNGVTRTVKYAVIFVDLNGDMKPNTPVWSKDNMVDIVAFVITSTGEVYPIGYPTVDTRYMTARVLYPGGDADGTPEYSKAMSYLNAKYAAWGNITNPSNHKTIDFVTGDANYTGGNLVIDASNFPPPYPSVDATGGCIPNSVNGILPEVTSECDVEITQYY